VRDHEANYLAWKEDPQKKKETEAELKAFKESVAQAATMFWSVYLRQLPERPDALGRERIEKMMPGVDPDPSEK
jgi:hypothetical protein